jgi:hypothetical protein
MLGLTPWQELIGGGVTFTLQGTTTVSGTGLTLNNNTIITNTGTLTFEPGAEISGQVCCVSPDQIVNQGSFIIPPSGSPQTVTFNAVAFNDNGMASIGSNDTLDLQHEGCPISRSRTWKALFFSFDSRYLSRAESNDMVSLQETSTARYTVVAK